MAEFLIAHKRTGRNEGGWSKVDGDTGLETYCGISRKWFPKWLGWGIIDIKKPLKQGQLINDPTLTKLVDVFYKVEFWDKIGGDKIPSQSLANQVYDMAVNASVETAKALLKKS